MGKLTVKYSKREKELICHYPDSSDSRMVYDMLHSKRHHPLPLPYGEFNDSFLEELTKRGYDIKTLKFSIEKL